jgi:hypothetical protein
MRPVMRLWLAAAALIAAGALGAGIALGLRSPQVSHDSAAAARSPQPAAGRAAPAGPAATARTAARYSFSTFGAAGDATFNQLLGINNNGHIAGYFGSGAAGHPNRGYILRPPYGPARYQDIDVPGSAQTQLTGLNDEGVQVGFWSASAAAGRASDKVAFYVKGGRYVSVGFPARDRSSPPVNRLLGVNNDNVAVGSYTDAAGHDHGYLYDIATKRFSPVSVPGATSVTATAINNYGSVAGFAAGRGPGTEGFFQRHTGQVYLLRVPGARTTEALGVNDKGEVVGAYQVGRGAGATTHGFTWTRQRGFITVDDPAGPGATTISGVNNAGDLVGFYVNAAGQTDGLVATPDR